LIIGDHTFPSRIGDSRDHEKEFNWKIYIDVSITNNNFLYSKASIKATGIVKPDEKLVRIFNTIANPNLGDGGKNCLSELISCNRELIKERVRQKNIDGVDVNNIEQHHDWTKLFLACIDNSNNCLEKNGMY